MDTYTGPSPPHFENPLVAPRPQKVTPEVPANMAHSLDQQLESRMAYNPNPGFVMPAPDRGSPLPPPNGSDWSPWATPAPQQQQRQQTYRANSFGPTPAPYTPPPADVTTANPSLTAPLPNIKALTAALQSIQNPAFDPSRKLVWCRDVFFLVDRLNQISSQSSETPSGPVNIEDPELLRLTQIAVPTVVAIASIQPPPNPLPAHVAEAIYLRATLASSGAYPQHVPLNPRVAFRDFEQAARGGHAPAWFRLGRDYEGFGDDKHARTCFERGVKSGVESCLYRIGMAHLMGQLGLPARPDLALPLLQRAATLATIHVAQPAYVYGLLLLGEFSHVSIPPQFFPMVIPPNSTPVTEARKHLERAAYLNFSPAQYKLGHAYEFAEAPFPFDALLSVQYYSLASQQGETEADMALSKWFLCGADGAFEKDEALAFTFAEKAARKGLPSAEFAMGYYAEVGVGGPKDVEVARRWYKRAMDHGNADAADRIAALSQPVAQALSRQEHDALTDVQLVRKRTQAKQKSEATGRGRAPVSAGQGQQILEVVRKNSIAMAPPMPAVAAANGRMPTLDEQQLANSPPMQQGRPPNDYPGQPQGQPPNGYPAPGQQQGRPPSEYPAPGQQQGRPSSEYPPGQQRLPHAQGPPAGNKAFAGQPRYNLTDPGSRSGSPAQQPQQQSLYQQSLPGRGPSAGPGGPSRPPQSTASVPPRDETPPPRQRPAANKVQTFQEMGFQSSKLEEKECVIM